MTLPTDQKVGGSSPSERTRRFRIKEVDGMYPTSFVGDLHPVHPLDAFGRPAGLPELRRCVRIEKPLIRLRCST